MPDIIEFELTEYQYEIVEPLFEKVISEASAGRKGLLVAQIWGDGTVKAKFIKKRIADQLVDILAPNKSKDQTQNLQLRCIDL